ncbi:hypothetical protein N7508_010055 [Penicillium antarcticum]|uniref:uncharacterized protein n=1 Tax=Penicillium antarcticum TaxID=416450 RepID=UPI00238E295A|nr:uncharacterized protein N7508_010055 [Penicillium antarcticum]KAJ5295234.1 hypothetical protein N7508_010055 [Penicillium antarcticum]
MTDDSFNQPGKPAVGPRNHLIFDPWQSASTGHQVANAGYSAHGTTGWRNMRAAKLSEQYQNGDCIQGRGQKEVSRGVAAKQPSLVPGAFDGRIPTQSPPKDGWEWEVVTKDISKQKQAGLRDIRSFMGVGKRKAVDESKEIEEKADKKAKYAEKKNQVEAQEKLQIESDFASGESNLSLKAKSTIFAGLTIYINGSTLPQISDHKLKLLLTSHGANYTIYLARKTVTHVVIGQPNAAGSGAGGGLSASKLQQEISRGGWKGVKVVNVDWAIESIKAGRRLAESRFPGMHVAAKGQRSVVGMFGAQAQSGTKK